MENEKTALILGINPHPLQLACYRWNYSRGGCGRIARFLPGQKKESILNTRTNEPSAWANTLPVMTSVISKASVID
ncbi:MAG: hypothetical protein D4S01_11375 [Dehalococcoidia bacterium]|nr:MAG: hypothetical protein D4S01_11375 [Dehalococcoidia bacterium]